jgi:hypothetical protein
MLFIDIYIPKISDIIHFDTKIKIFLNLSNIN